MRKKSVQNAEEQKPKSEPSPVAGENLATEQIQTSDAANAVPTVKGILAKIDSKKLRMAEEMGIPFQDLLIWAESVENTQKAIIESLSKLGNVSAEGIAEELKKKLEASAVKQRAEMTEKMRNAPQGEGGSSIKDLLVLGREAGIIGGGGGDSGFFAEMGKTWLARKMASEDFGEFMSKEMFKRVFPDAIAAWEVEVAKRAAAQAAKPPGA